MLTEAQNVIRYKAMEALGDKVYLLSQINQELMEEDEESKLLTLRQKTLFDEVVLIRYFLKTLQYPEYLTDEQIRRILEALKIVGSINDYPSAPLLFFVDEPAIIGGATGESGEQGVAGVNGSDANIDLVIDENDYSLSAVESTVEGVKTYTLSYTQYEEPTISITTDDGITIFEIGSANTVNIKVDSSNGSETIASRALTAPFAHTFSNTTGEEQLAVNGVASSGTYTVRINDGVDNYDASVYLEFLYPYLYGFSSTALSSPSHYNALSKILDVEGNQEVVLNGDFGHFYFMYENGYADLYKIEDHNGIDVTDFFTASTVSVTSSGLIANFTKTYKVYRTTEKTTISNKKYNFIFE
jgi:hypothetical protein